MVLQKKRKVVDPLLSALCSAIQERREFLRISQEELAGRCGLHRTYISAIERGSRNITLKSLSRLCGALEIATSELVKAAETNADYAKNNDPSRVYDDVIEDLLDKLIGELGMSEGDDGQQLMLEALWIKHRLKDTEWILPEGKELVLQRMMREDSLRHLPKADRTAKELMDNLKLWRRREAG
jgi:transcriptional regulator with XRE-family HTH domain